MPIYPQYSGDWSYAAVTRLDEHSYSRRHQVTSEGQSYIFKI